MRFLLSTALLVCWLPCWSLGQVPDFEQQVAPLLKNKCVRCHGPAKSEGKLNLALKPGLVRGGKSGQLFVAHDPEASLLWDQVVDDAMPQGEDPLSSTEKELLYNWIKAGAPGLPAEVSDTPDGDEHWAYQKLNPPAVPVVRDTTRVRTSVDRFLQARLEQQGLQLGPDASRTTLIRRVAFDLTGLPPSLIEIQEFENDQASDAYERMVERYLASPRYGERWGKYWLDTAGYADSNGYFNADTDRPLAWRYRDYVIRAINADMPFDQFIREQLAGDELARYTPDIELTSRELEMLTATHYLRNSADGTDSSDGNEDEVRADKYAVLEGTLQIMGSSLFGMTIQCARCHSHKFEPFTHTDYYSLQAVIYPAFNVEHWAKTNNRQIPAVPLSEWRAAEESVKAFEAELTRRKQEHQEWLKAHPEPSVVVFADDFDSPGVTVAAHWSNTAPGDTQPLGTPVVTLDSSNAPAVQISDGKLKIHESGAVGDRAISTRAAIDWTPESTGGWVQATFELVEGAPYVGYLIALHDYGDAQAGQGGNVLFDGAAGGKAKVYLDYPGGDSKQPGAIGQSGYTPGHRYGVRVTNVGEGQFELAQVVDSVPEPNTVKVPASALPDGGFGFALCCGRSFVVDQVRIESSLDSAELAGEAAESHKARQAEVSAFAASIQEFEKQRPVMPGKLAPVVDGSDQAPEVFLLERGNYKAHGAKMQAAPPAFLRELSEGEVFSTKPDDLKGSTGRRLALAQWLTRPDSRSSALLARVTVNRWWQHHFGVGLAATTDNLGYSGTPPTHPELLEFLATEFVNSGWSQKAIHRLILNSTAYRQTSEASPEALKVDSDNRLLAWFPLRRLDAEAIRDGMLAVSGELDRAEGGPYVPTERGGDGQVFVNEGVSGATRRSVYLQQRRTQVAGFLEVFDAPTIVFNCSARVATTVPLQSLSLLNSPFVRKRAEVFAGRLEREVPEDPPQARLNRAFLLAWGRSPSAAEFQSAETFIHEQMQVYAGQDNASHRAWTDLAQMLLAANPFLYVE